MNLGSLLVLTKLFTDALGPVSLVGPPAPNGQILELQEEAAACYTPKGKLTWLCYLKYVDPAASYTDYQDYLKGV